MEGTVWWEAHEHPSCNGNEAESQPHTQLVWKDHVDISSSNGSRLELDDLSIYSK